MATHDAYIEAAISKRECEFIAEDGIYYCNIPGLRGVWASGTTLDACVDELRDVLDGWIQLGIELGHPIPVLDGLDISAAAVD